MKAIKYLIIDAVLVSCLIAYNAAPGITDMLETLSKELMIGIYLVLLLTSDFYWLKTLLSIRQIRIYRIFCFTIFVFMTLINFFCTIEMVLGLIWSIYRFS